MLARGGMESMQSNLQWPQDALGMKLAPQWITCLNAEGFFMVINIYFSMIPTFSQKIPVRSVIRSLTLPHTIQLTVVHALPFYFF